MSQQCFHCQQPVLGNQATVVSQIDNTSRFFCCIGCQSVSEAIHQLGMGGFYNRTNATSKLKPPSTEHSDYSVFDLDAVQQEYIAVLNNDRTIRLMIEGIHCAACVWLIEQRLKKLTGVITANVNLTAKSLTLRWNNNDIKLSEVLTHLFEIGYQGLPYDPDLAEGQLQKENKDWLYRLGFAGFSAMNLMWISIALYTGADNGEYKQFFYWMGFGFATATLSYSALPFFKGAWKGLKNRHLTMDLPIVIGALATWSYSSYVTFFNVANADVYFDTVANFIFVILIGRFLESIAKRKAVSISQRLLDLQPKIATIKVNNDWSVVAIKAVKKKDVVLVKAGERISVDGLIIKGQSDVDESMLSGESNAVAKMVGDFVSAGTQNKNGVLQISVTETVKNNALSKIVDLVDQAQSSKAPIQCTVDKIVPWFVFITLLLATITFIYWLPDGFEQALLAATSVLIITCPCAFGLATPMAIAVATGVAAKEGILIKTGAVLEILSSIKHYVFDKTGTLTQGELRVVKVVDESTDINKILCAIYAVERLSEHASASALLHYVKKQNIKIENAKVENVSIEIGMGIRASVDGINICIGNIKMVENHGVTLPDEDDDNNSVIYCYMDNVGLVKFTVEDELRDDAYITIKKIHQYGIFTTLLSGDRLNVANKIAQQLNIEDVIAEVKPAEKENCIKNLQNKGNTIAMVGDGINDAPALIRADIGIAMGSGTDVSMDCADIVLLDGQLNKIVMASEISSMTLNTIKQNIRLSIAYNIIMVPLAMSAMITPLIAAIAMPISSLIVIVNSARIHGRFNRFLKEK